MSKELEVRAWEYRHNGWATGVMDVILNKPLYSDEKWPLCRIAEAQAEIAGLKTYAATIAAERDAAMAECQEQARLNGMGSEREARLMAERDAALMRCEHADEQSKQLAEAHEFIKFATGLVATKSGRLVDSSALIKELGEFNEWKAGRDALAKELAEAKLEEQACRAEWNRANAGWDEAKAELASLKAQSEPVAWLFTESGGVRFINFLDQGPRDGWTRQALYTRPPAAIPEGWQVVPKEPTPEMLPDAWREAYGNCNHDTIKRIYRAMLAAAPKP